MVRLVLTLGLLTSVSASGAFAQVTCDSTVADGESIQTAVDAASSGDTICVEAGTYEEQVVIVKDLTLEGAGAGSTTITAPSPLAASSNVSGSSGEDRWFLVEIFGAVTVTVSDFTIDGSRSPANAVLHAGIYAGGGATVTIENNTVTDTADSPLTGAQHGDGIIVGGQGVEFELAGTSGTATIANNTIDNYQKHGILAMRPDTEVTIRNNVVTGQGQAASFDANIGAHGIQVANNATGTVEGNTVENNDSGDRNHGNPGIYINQSGGVAVTGNTVRNNERGIVTNGTPSTLASSASENFIVGNGTGVFNAVGAEFDARFNWWGDSSGPSGEGPGDGDSVSVNVDFDPWCTIEVPDCQPPSGGPAPDPDPEPVTESTGDEATEDEPLVVTVFSPQGGPVEIDVVETVSDPPPGWVFADLKAIIEAPDASVEEPIEIEFRLHESQLGEGQDHTDVEVLRDGEFVEACDDPDAGVADPDPCVQSRESEDDEVVITVLTSQASTWHLAMRVVREPEPCPSVAAFPDVDPESVHAEAIGCAAFHDIARGFADGTYRPAVEVRRDQMASFIARTLDAAGQTLPAAQHSFADLDGNVHADAVGRLAAAGIVHGTTSTTYSPADPVRRDQMASFLVRALGWALDGQLATTGGPYFADTAGNTHEDAIDVAFEQGLTVGRTADLYGPADGVRRDQMATFLIRLLDRID